MHEFVILAHILRSRRQNAQLTSFLSKKTLLIVMQITFKQVHALDPVPIYFVR